MEPINVIIEETRKKMAEATKGFVGQPVNAETIKNIQKAVEAEIFNAFNATAELAKAIPAIYQAKPLTAEDLDEFKRLWIKEMNKPQSFEAKVMVDPSEEGWRLEKPKIWTTLPLTMEEVDPIGAFRRYERVGISVLKTYEPQVSIKGV